MYTFELVNPEKMKKIIAVFILLYCNNINAQLFDWAKTISGSGDELATSIAIDDSSNTYVVGYFQSQISFNRSIGSITLTSKGSYDFFISKFDCSGNAIWAVQVGGVGNERSDVPWGGVVFNNITKKIVFCTSIGSSATAYAMNGINQSISTSGGSRDAVIGSYDLNGNISWINSYGGSGDDRPEAMCIDPLGNIIIRGEFENTVAFGSTNLSSSGVHDLFLLKLTSGGTFIWVRKEGGASDEACNNRIMTDNSGNIYVNGNTSGTLTIGSRTITHYGAWGVYFVKYDSSGNTKWFMNSGNTGSMAGPSIVVDNNKNAYITSMFSNSVTYYDNSNSSINVSNNGSNYDIAIFKIDSNGNFVWSKKGASTGSEITYNIAIDYKSNIYISGTFSGSFGFGSLTKVTNGGIDGYILMIDSSGKEKTLRTFGGTGNDEDFYSYIDNTGFLYTCGYYNNSVTFGNSTLNAVGQGDAFFAKSKIDSFFSFLPDSVALCNISSYTIIPLIYAYSYLWNNNDTTFSITINSTGWYKLKILHYCDYLVDSIYVEFTSMNQPVITLSGNTLNSNYTSGNQWYSNGVIIPGATAQSYSPPISGSYSVKVTSNGCSSLMSTDFDFSLIGINSFPFKSIEIYPNPFKDEITINGLPDNHLKEIILYDIMGREVFKSSPNPKSNLILNTSLLSEGTYLLKIVGIDGMVTTFKLIK